jgi:hypothetical protein
MTGDTQIMNAIDELERLRKQRAEQLKAEAAAEAEEKIAAETARLKRDIADGERWLELKASSNAAKLVRVNTVDHGMLVVRSPGRGAWDEFQDKLKSDADLTSQVAYLFVCECLVYPSVDRFDEIRERSPALLTVLTNAIGIAAGQGSAEIQKK